MLVYCFRIITIEVVQEISVIFHECISGPWIKYSEYPTEAFDNLFRNLKNAGFTYTCTEEELKEVVHQCVKSRYLDCVAPTMWRQMVDKWMDENWKVICRNPKV